MRVSTEILISVLRIATAEEDSQVNKSTFIMAADRLYELNARIKRLEEAGDEVIWAFRPASILMMTERESDALKLWTKAKEAKP